MRTRPLIFDTNNKCHADSPEVGWAVPTNHTFDIPLQFPGKVAPNLRERPGVRDFIDGAMFRLSLDIIGRYLTRRNAAAWQTGSSRKRKARHPTGRRTLLEFPPHGKIGSSRKRKAHGKATGCSPVGVGCVHIAKTLGNPIVRMDVEPNNDSRNSREGAGCA